MQCTRLTDLPVRHLEHVFSPPGLPLPAKGESDQGTTSILVRGGAGTGKTTFALALAHAIAKAGNGLVLYLTTEFSPVEIAFKATLIGLPEEVVDVWPGAEGLPSGGVVVEHLSAVRNGRPVLSSAERKRGVIDAVWGLLHPEPEEGDARRPPLPVRSVVIDALTLPEPGEHDGALRADLVAFVQALESEGVSVVLVEELAPGAAAWSSFVVDAVFELAFHPDAETGDLRRKLIVSKSRYAISIPGPHDYGLQNGVPSVWPDIFRVVTLARESSGPPLFRAVPPRLVVPMSVEDVWSWLDASIILSPFDKTLSKALHVLRSTPGSKEMIITCGASTVIATASQNLTVSEDDGIHAIGWGILSNVEKAEANECVFQDIERFLSHSGSTARVIRLLEALTWMGFMVCVHSPAAAIAPLYPVADLVWDGKRRMARLPKHPQRSLARRCLRVPWLEESAPATRFITGIDEVREETVLRERRKDLDDLIVTASETSATMHDWLSLTTAREHSGTKMPKEDLSRLKQARGKHSHRAAWLALQAGADWHAARAALAAVESETPDPSLLLLWKAICASLAQNRAAMDELDSLLGSPDEALILDPLLRGLGATDQLDEADRIITDIGARHALTPWQIERLHAEVRLDSEVDTALKDAASRLLSLTADETLPLIDRAEIWHNLGVARDRLDDRSGALAAFEQASKLNPFLDAAREELERLRSPKPAP